MRTLILGGGGVGSLIAAYLSRAGRQVVVLDRWREHVDAVNREGLRVEAVEEEFTVAVDYRLLGEAGDSTPFDLVAIATKAYDTLPMLDVARAHSHPRSLVVAAQNGMPEDAIRAVHADVRLVGCVVGLGAQMLAPGRVRRTTSASEDGSIHLGLAPPTDVSAGELGDVRAELEPVGGVRIESNVEALRWAKLTVNASTNALSGLTGCDVSELWSSNATLDIVIALAVECAAVAHAAGVKMPPILGVSHGQWLAAESTLDPEWEAIRNSLRGQAAQRVGSKATRASMLQDVLNGRPTEIAYINGWLVSRAVGLGIAVPIQERVVDAFQPVGEQRTSPDRSHAAPLLELVRNHYRSGSRSSLSNAH